MRIQTQDIAETALTVPTKSALSLLEELLLSTNPASNERARVLIGAYGKGKSHIVLTILSMLLKKDLALFERLMPKVTENPRLLQLVHNYYESCAIVIALPTLQASSSSKETIRKMFSLPITFFASNVTAYRSSLSMQSRLKPYISEIPLFFAFLSAFA